MGRNIAITLFASITTTVLTSVGILLLVFNRAAFDVVFGILILCFAVAVLTGLIILGRLLSDQARKVRLQTDFVAKVSHELRTPLASIRMFVDTLQSGGIDDPKERTTCLDVISTETSRLTAMIERLLKWGRMEAGKRSFQFRPESTDTLVGEALAQFEPQLQATKAEVQLELPDEVPAVNADREALVEALLNLLNNALKYGGEDGKIIVRLRHEKKRVLIDVIDQGPGIPRHEHRRIFEKFYRVLSPLTAHTKGSGLGLAMANLVVRAHRGKIRLSSEPGSGAHFTIDLPALAERTAALEVPAG